MMLLSILQCLLLSTFFIVGQLSAADTETAGAASGGQLESGTDNAAGAITRYRALIRDHELQRGVYDQRLSEDLLGLGQALRAAGQHQLALEAFRRSLHVSRINQGLESPAQLPILDALIEQNIKLENWQNADKNHSYLYWISVRNLGDMSLQLLPVIDRIGEWHLMAHDLDEDTRGYLHLLQANRLAEKAISIIDASGEKTDLQLIAALQRAVGIYYRIAVDATSAAEIATMQSALQPVRRTQSLSAEEVDNRNNVALSYRHGKKAILRILEIYSKNPALPYASHAWAMAQLGDWYLLFGKRDSAAKSYRKTYDLLMEGGLDATSINQIFSQPVRLPAFAQSGLSMPDAIDADYVVAEFDLSRTGRARNIQIVDSSPADDNDFRRQAKRAISKDRFRPRLEGGIPIKASGVSLKYAYSR